MVIISNIVWIDEDIDKGENINYVNCLKSIGYLRVRCFTKIDKAITHLKYIEFQDTKIIITENLYNDFKQKFEENLIDMCVAPKLIIFLKNPKNFTFYQNMNNSFYNSGVIKTSFKEIKDYLLNKNVPKMQKHNDAQLTFEYIDCQEKLALPLFYKTLIDVISNNNFDNYTQSIYNNYYIQSKEINELLEPIKSMSNIPIEILSKYYARAYTVQSNFYQDMNKDLGLNKREKYLPFIKALYEGIKTKSLPLATNTKLYRGSKISKTEINIIKNYLKHKIKNFPGAIVFSKSFLSFTKEKSIAENFLNYPNKNNNLFKVLYVLEKDDNLGYNLATHSDIEKISAFPNEREVLFLPFSSFEIKEIKEINIGFEKGYEIKLLYLGKYLKEIENHVKSTNINKIPNSEFKKQLLESGLIKKEKIENTNIKNIINEYKKYENDINSNKNPKVIQKNIINNKLSNLILNSDKNDKIMNLINKLYKKGLISDYIEYKDSIGPIGDMSYTDEIVVAKKFIFSQNCSNVNYKNWVPAWHGTKFKYLESIAENGLKLPGSELKDGSYTPKPIDIPVVNEIEKIKNWENAIFASPNIFFALNYCDKSNKDIYDWTGLIEVKIKPKSFTRHKSKFIYKYFSGHFHLNEDYLLDDIFRIPSEDSIILTSITFVYNFYTMRNSGGKLMIGFYKD